MYNLTDKISSREQLLSEAQLSELKRTEQYLKKNNVEGLLKEALAMLIQTKPTKVRQGLVEIFKKIKENETFFKKIDFEAMYDSLNFFNGKRQSVTFYHLLQRLQNIGVQCSKQSFLEKYPQYKLDKYVQKHEFIKIAQQFYSKGVKIPEQQWTPIPIINKPRPAFRGYFNRIMYKDVGFDKFINPIKKFFESKYNLLLNMRMISKRGGFLVEDKKFLDLMRIIEQDQFKLQNCIQIAGKVFELFKKDHSAFHIIAHLFCQFFWVKKFKEKMKVLDIQQQLSVIIKRLCKAFPPTVPGQQSVTQDVPFPTVPERKINLFGDNDGTYFASYQTLLYHMQIVNNKAKDSFPNFKELVQKIGKENNGFHYKTGMKLPKEVYDWFKVLIRVMQKMFPQIKSRKNAIILEAQIKLEALGSANMQTVMSTILEVWVNQVNDILVHRGGKAQYYITDLVRGKCMFKNLMGIKKAVNAVIRQCAQKQYEIVQLDNRLKKVTQDVVFKILIGGIVCQFQLALQFECTQFQFGHCFYEIDRSPLGAIFGSYLFLGKDVFYPFLGQVKDTLAMFTEQKYAQYVQKDQKLVKTLSFIMESFTESNK